MPSGKIVAALAAAFGLLPFAAAAAQSSHIVIGDKDCAKAEIVGDILDQLYYEPVRLPPPDISTDGFYRASLKVERVVYGPLSKGPLSVNFIAHNYFDPENRHIRFFLRQAGSGEWWIVLRCA